METILIKMTIPKKDIINTIFWSAKSFGSLVNSDHFQKKWSTWGQKGDECNYDHPKDGYHIITEFWFDEDVPDSWEKDLRVRNASWWEFEYGSDVWAHRVRGNIEGWREKYLGNWGQGLPRIQSTNMQYDNHLDLPMNTNEEDWFEKQVRMSSSAHAENRVAVHFGGKEKRHYMCPEMEWIQTGRIGRNLSMDGKSRIPIRVSYLVGYWMSENWFLKTEWS
jgi:hypothetical protein